MNCLFCKKEIKKNDITDGEAVSLAKDSKIVYACTSHHGVLEEKKRQEGKSDA